MDFWHGFAVITVVHLLAAASPGPDFAYVTRQSLVHGRKAGLLASAGIALGSRFTSCIPRPASPLSSPTRRTG